MNATHALLWHRLFELVGIAVGAQYFFQLRRRGSHGSAFAGANYAVAIGCVLGAALGNKLVFWLQQPQLLNKLWGTGQFWWMGQSMVGGLLGGLIGVEIAKKIAGYRASTGDYFVAPILLGLMIGRIGCFIAGLHDDTYGNATTLPWGIDFGDGVQRHPTQLYEIAFAAALWWSLAAARPALADRPGLSFKLMLCAYLLWRLLIDALKPLPYAYLGGLSGIQVVCIVALLVYAPLAIKQWRRA